MRVGTWAMIVSVVLALAACGGGTTSSATPRAATPGAASSNPSPVAVSTLAIGSFAIPSFTGDGTGGSFTLKVEGGSLAGTYSANEPTGGCFVSAGQLQFALEATGAGPDGTNLFVSVNVPLAAATAGTSEFILSVAFGDVDQGGTVASYPSQSVNDGTLKADDRGESIAVTGSGTAFGVATDGSSETMKLTLEAECTTIGRF